MCCFDSLAMQYAPSLCIEGVHPADHNSELDIHDII